MKPPIASYSVPGEKKTRSFLMLADDLPALAQMLQCNFLIQAPASPWIVRMKGMAKHESVAYKHPDSTSRTFEMLVHPRSMERKAMTAGLEASLLATLTNIGFGAQKITVQDSVQSSEAQLDIPKRMVPKRAWPTLIAWNLIDAAQRMKLKADDLVMKGEHSLAIEKYQGLFNPGFECTLFNYSLDIYNSDCVIPTAILTYRLIDAAVTTGFLQLRTGGCAAANTTGGAIQAVSRGRTFLQQVSGYEEQVFAEKGRTLFCAQGTIWLNYLCFFLQSRKRPQMSELPGHLQRLADDVSTSTASAHVTYDTEIVRNILENDKVRDFQFLA